MFKSYKERKAQKLAQKTAKTLAKTAATSRKPAEIEKDCESFVSSIGKLYHQKKCIEAELAQKTQGFHNLMIELDGSLKIWPKTDPVVTEAPVTPEMERAIEAF